MSAIELTTAGFSLVRTPRLSLHELKRLPADHNALDDVLARWLREPGWREALYLATPSLLARAEQEFIKKQQFSEKTRQALLKYLVRMSSRPTPFGLFAAVSLGTFGSGTELQIGPPELDRKVSRLDMEYWYGLRQQLSRQTDLQTLLLYRFNSTFVALGSSAHYIEPYHTGNQQYRLSAVSVDEAILAVQQLAIQPQSISALTEQLAARWPETTVAEIQQYLQTLIDERLLLPELPLPLTGPGPELAFLAALAPVNPSLAAELQHITAELRALDRQQVAPVSGYQAIFTQLQNLSASVKENKLIQTDLYRPMPQACLDNAYQRQIEQTLLALQTLQAPATSVMRDFIDEFQRRFEGQAVPLLLALNEEAGISFSAETGYETPLLAGVHIRKSGRSKTVTPTAALERCLEAALLQSQSPRVLQLHSADLLRDGDSNRLLLGQLPVSFATTIACYQQDGEVLIHLLGCSGPSGSNLIGRFCHLEPALLEQVQEYHRQEQLLCGDVLLAEIVHSPDGRPGNVIARPHLRPDEIVFLADSCLPEAAQISVDDLLVYVEDDKVKLWSQSRQQQILPRLSCAHNFSQRSLGIYRFLAMLGLQYGQTPKFAVPPAWSQASFCPRVMLDNVILAEACWMIPLARLQQLLKNGELDQQAWQALAAEYQLDEWVSYAVADHVLTVRLTHPPMLAMLLQECQHLRGVRLKEVLPMKLQPLCQGRDGAFAHEIVLPWLNPQSLLPVTMWVPSHNPPALERRFGPGSPWLSLKLYANASSAELCLIQLTEHLQHWQQQQRIDGWFFIRYGDPDWHLRLRLHGQPEQLCQLLPSIWQLLSPQLQSQQLHKIEIFTYEQEVERYGGAQAIRLAEQMFCIDSSYASQVVALCQQLGEQFRVRAQVAVVRCYLRAFGLDGPAQLTLISSLRESFGREFQENLQLRQQFGQKFRLYQADLTADWRDIRQPELAALCSTLTRALVPLADEIHTLAQQQQLTIGIHGLLSSLLHMSLNRLSKVYGREQELVIYDFCRRLLLAEQSKAQRALPE